MSLFIGDVYCLVPSSCLQYPEEISQVSLAARKARMTISYIDDTCVAAASAAAYALLCVWSERALWRPGSSTAVAAALMANPRWESPPNEHVRSRGISDQDSNDNVQNGQSWGEWQWYQRLQLSRQLWMGWESSSLGEVFRGQRMAAQPGGARVPTGGDLHVAYRHWIVAHSSRLLPIAHLPLLTLKYIQNISCTATSTHCMLKYVLWHGLCVWACSTYRKEKLIS